MDKFVSQGIKYRLGTPLDSYINLSSNGETEMYSQDPVDANTWCGFYFAPNFMDFYASDNTQVTFTCFKEVVTPGDMGFLFGETTTGDAKKIDVADVKSILELPTVITNGSDTATPDGIGGWGTPAYYKITVPTGKVVQFEFFQKFEGNSDDYRFSTKFALTAGIPTDTEVSVIMELSQVDHSVIRKTITDPSGLYSNMDWDGQVGYDNDAIKILKISGTLVNKAGGDKEWSFEYRSFAGTGGLLYKFAKGGSLKYEVVGNTV